MKSNHHNELQVLEKMSWIQEAWKGSERFKIPQFFFSKNSFSLHWMVKKLERWKDMVEQSAWRIRE